MFTFKSNEHNLLSSLVYNMIYPLKYIEQLFLDECSLYSRTTMQVHPKNGFGSFVVVTPGPRMAWHLTLGIIGT